jgi:CBS domain-containing protein
MESVDDMKVSDIMTERPASVRLHNTLGDILKIMEQIGCHHVPVMDTENHLVGIISDRDCRLAINSPYINYKHQHNSELVNSLSARMLMIPTPFVISPDAEAVDAAKLMLTHEISCLPVLDNKTLVGIITRTDILMTFLNPLE